MSKPTAAAMKPEEYSHSAIHRAVVLRDRIALLRILGSLPRPADPSSVMTEEESVEQERLADEISAVVDRRDVPHGETPLHLAVRGNDVHAVKALISAGADPSLHNAAGWNALQEAVIASRRGDRGISVALARHLHACNWSKFRRKLPRLVAALRRMRDFYMEITFHFESSVVPFVGKVLPSDTYRIWKRDGNLRADTTLAGFDGLKIQRADQSFLFLGDEGRWESLFVVNRDKRTFFDAFEGACEELSDAEVASYVSQTSVVRPGMDVTRAELAGRTNWRRQEKFERVGEWNSKVYDVNNVSFSFRTRKLVNEKSRNDAVLPLELDEDDDGFLVAENPRFSTSSQFDKRRHSSFVKDDIGGRTRGDVVTVGRKSVDIIPCSSSSQPTSSSSSFARRSSSRLPATPIGIDAAPPMTKEKEFLKHLKPSVWLTEDFPLKTEELLPLLDILSGKVKAIRRMREMLTTKFPPGTFPVKFAIPVVPTVKVVVTFTKFEHLPAAERFYTPFSSPVSRDGGEKMTSAFSVRGEQEEDDPFVIPNGYKRYSSKGKSGMKGKC